jgi:hypothetical protein
MTNKSTSLRSVTRLSDDWRRWIAENLILGSHPNTLAKILTDNGVPLDEAHAEVDAALASPYLHGGQRVRNRLAKREWVLGIRSRLDRLAPLAIARRENISGHEFLHQYYSTNTPVIITGALDECAALRNWNLDYFARHFGDRQVEVQFGREADANYEMNSIAHKRQLPFGDFVDMVRHSGRTNDFYMTANNDSKNRAALHELWRDVPLLPEYLRQQPGGDGFFWFGPAGTVTPFHHDLTNNFMSQIIGRKRVRLIAPWEAARVYNHRHCFTDVDGRAIDLARFPAMADVPVLDCELAPGEILFLPVGWWHFVEALDISVTIAATNFIWDNDFYSSYPSEHDF